jgi:hypothetical protein
MYCKPFSITHNCMEYLLNKLLSASSRRAELALATMYQQQDEINQRICFILPGLTSPSNQSEANGSGAFSRSTQVLGSTSRPGFSTNSPTCSRDQKSNRLDQQNRNSSVVSKTPNPRSLFECLPSFYPESFVVEPTPSVIYYSGVNVASFEHARINRCILFFASTPRKWIRLTISVTVTDNSKYWDTWMLADYDKTGKDDYSHCIDLPKDLRAILADYFERSYRELVPDSHLGIFLSSQSVLPQNQVEASQFPDVAIKTHLQDITNTIRHLNCPRYSEEDLAPQPLYAAYKKNKLRNKFIAFIESHWVFMDRFGSSMEHRNSLLYNLQVQHCLKGKSGFDTFAGIVLDEAYTITAFLREIPRTGHLSHVLANAQLSGRPISMERREKWCRQLIQRTAAVHSNQFVVGSLGEVRGRGPAGVDGHDNIVLYDSFRRNFSLNNAELASIPPEHHPVAMNSAAEVETACAESDLYQLGLLLWCVIGYRPYGPTNYFPYCATNGCRGITDGVCSEPFSHSIQLPLPKQDTTGQLIPQYMENIIAACRQERPHRRPPAWQLLEKLPQFVESETRQRPPSYVTQPEECSGLYGGAIICDNCIRLTTKHYFDCENGHTNSFELCPDCFKMGRHCSDSQHILAEHFGR